MRVVHLVQDRGIRPDSKKGASVHVTAMCEAFRALGAEVVQIHASSAEQASERLAAATELGPIDLIYERYALSAFEGSRAALELGIPHVLEVNAPLESEAEKWRGADGASLDRAQETKIFQSAHAVLCVSPPVATYAMSRGAPPAATLVRPNGVDASLFRPLPEVDAQRATWFPELDSPFIVGFHGRLRPWHGFQRVVEACASALKRGVNLSVLCVGEGDYAEYLEGALPLSRWRHEPWCAQRQLARWVAGFHTIAFGYDPEGDYYFSPLKLREAMAAGVVPIVPDLGHLPGAVDMGRAGVIYDPADPGALCAAIEALARDADRRGGLARAARELASTTTWTQIAQDVLDACKKERA